jgi:tellurite resistance protein TerC
METILFPFSEYYWFYAAFLAFVLMMLALDLGVFHRSAHEVSIKEATAWSVVWVTLALLFNVGLYYYAAWKFPQDERLMAIPGLDPDAAATAVGLEYLTGYVVEKALSVDNIFVFVMVFAYFAVPKIYQHRVLVLRHFGRAHFPGDFHRRGFVSDAVSLGHLRFRRVPYHHRNQDDARAGQGNRPGEEFSYQAV